MEEVYFGLESELIDLEKINPNVTRGLCKIAYTDENRKRFNIKKEVFEEAFNTLKGSPVLAHFFYDRQDGLKDEIGGHEDDRVQNQGGFAITGRTHAYGFVDYTTEPYFKTINGKDWLFAKVYIWTGRFPESELILNSKQSMEVKFFGVKKEDNYLVPTKMQFLGLCALNKDRVTPVFEGSEFARFSSDDFSKDIESMKEEFSKILFADNDPSTPAPKKDQIKGSEKNKKGSASNTKGGIKISQNETKALKNMMQRHNDKQDSKSKKVTMGQLKAVYRRGLGAYSTSHRPNASRQGWGYKRVEAFLYLVGKGKPKNPKYKQDNDLLKKEIREKVEGKKTNNSIDMELLNNEEYVDNYEFSYDEYLYYADFSIFGDILDYLESEGANPYLLDTDGLNMLYDEISELQEYIEFADEDLTNFPKKGDNEKVSLRNSNYPIFDKEYAKNLKNDYPDIWKKGGNILGNTQYNRLVKVLEKNEVETPTDEKAVRLREAWMARHYRDKLIAGVVAQIKWLGIGSRGEKYMKDLVNDEKKKENNSNFAIEKGVNDSIKINTSKEKAIDGSVGEKDVQELKRKVVEAKNYKELIPKVFLRVPNNLDDFNLSDLGYPVMYFRNGELFYHLGFVKAASSRLQAQKDQSYYGEVKNKLTKVREKLGMSKIFSEVKNMDMAKMKEKFMGMYKHMMDKGMDMAMEYADNMMYAMDKNACYAMDCMEGKVVKIPYAMMENEMAMQEEQMMMEEEGMAMKEMMGMMPKFMQDMMDKNMAMEKMMMEEKGKMAKDMKTMEDTMADMKAKYGKMEGMYSEAQETIKEKDSKISEFSSKIRELELSDEAKSMLAEEKFSFLTANDKAELLGKLSEVSTLDEFEKEVKLFSFDKVQKETKFSFMSVEGLKANKKEDDAKDEPKTVYDRL